MKRLWIAVAVSGILAGCAVNPYEKYYMDKTNGVDLRALGAKVYSEPPQLIQGTTPINDYQTMFGNGYGLIGTSEFNGKEFPTKLALEQAQKIGATRVIVYHQYTDTEHGAAPIVLPTFGSAVTHVAGLGSVSTTAVGTTTSMVPTSVRRYEQGATYWVPIPPGILGVQARDLNSEERAKLQSNKGVRVVAIMKHTPAFEADILIDDIVRTLDGVDIDDAQGFRAALKIHAGQNVTLTILRGDKVVSKAVKLNPAS